MRAQINLEFLISLAIMFTLFFSLLLLINAKQGELKESQKKNILQTASEMIADAINCAETEKNAGKIFLQLPEGEYTLALKGRRVEARSEGAEYASPILTDSVIFEKINAGEKISVEKFEGVVYVKKA